MYIPSFLWIGQESIIASSNTVGELFSDFVVNNFCDLLVAYPLALMVPSYFSFRNIRYQRAFFLCIHDIYSFLNGICYSHSCSWLRSLSSASFPLVPYFHIPSLTFICIISICPCSLCKLLLVDCCPACGIVYFLLL